MIASSRKLLLKGFKCVECNYKSYSGSSLSFERIIEYVPSLGDSITEGTISKWTKNVGDVLIVDDVVAIIETDKVTVDIKSTLGGILTKLLAQETAVVGKPLYEVETDLSSNSPRTVDTIINSGHHEIKKKTGFRVPLIKFRGKREHIKNSSRIIGNNESISNLLIPKTTQMKAKTASTAVEFYSLSNGALYGRPLFSNKEIEAIETGGATM